MELSGTWRAGAADESLRRTFSRPDLDDSAWAELEVPGHWRSHPAFATHDGPVLYRRRFEAPRPATDERLWLVLDGLFYQGDVWLDGGYVGDTEGYFVPHAFEVTEALADREEHVLAVEVACAHPTDLHAKRNLTGVFQHSDFLDPQWNPGGIWRPVRVERTGPVRIRSLRVLCRDANEERAVVVCRALLDAAEAGPATLRTTIGGTDHEQRQPLAAGENRVEWTVSVERPALWWPHALGDQPRCDVTVEVMVNGNSTPSDRRELRTGLRQVRMRRWCLQVNGERLFLKGANLGPTRLALAEATATELATDVRLAKEAGLDLLRVHAHVSRPELYEAADRAGVLLWQDLPLQWGYARGTRGQAARQAKAAVDLLGHHPSIAVWCGHDEPVAVAYEPALFTDAGKARRARIRRLIGQELPSWNKTILDHSVRRALERSDRTRPVVAHSGVWPHPGSGGTDSHLWLGWHRYEERSLTRLLAAFPRLARFVSAFGAQAAPDTTDFADPGRWPDLDWEELTLRHALQKPVLDARVPPDAHATFDAWRKATQEYQATLVRHQVEALRRIKYRPTGGFCYALLADGHPGITWSLLDHVRAPKAGYAALAEACRPVLVTAERPAAVYAPGDTIALAVHVVSDLRAPLEAAVARATLSWEGGEASWAWQGDVAADECTYVGTLTVVVPDASGPLRLDLALEHPSAESRNRYESRISRPAEADARMTG
jgi:beta-mannosidase